MSPNLAFKNLEFDATTNVLLPLVAMVHHKSGLILNHMDFWWYIGLTLTLFYWNSIINYYR